MSKFLVLLILTGCCCQKDPTRIPLPVGSCYAFAATDGFGKRDERIVEILSTGEQGVRYQITDKYWRPPAEEVSWSFFLSKQPFPVTCKD